MVRDSTGIDFVSDTTGVSVATDPPTSGNWINEDINNDDRIDIGLRDPDGSKYGSLYTLYAACGEGRYVKVLSETAYKLRLAESDPGTPTDRPVSSHAVTTDGKQWRQLVHVARGVNVLPNRSNVTAVSRVYRMYEHLERYAVVPGSAWYVDDIPYSTSVLQQVEHLPPNCTAGRKPPRIIGNEKAKKVVWRGNLNRDKHEDIIIKEENEGEEGPEYSLEVYAGCEKLWYSPVYQKSVFSFNVQSKNRNIWRKIDITKYNSGEIERKTIEYKHSKYKAIDTNRKTLQSTRHSRFSSEK